MQPIGYGRSTTNLSNYPVYGFTITEDSLYISPGDTEVYVYRNPNCQKLPNVIYKHPIDI
jgi:hypothetical protein